MKEQKHLKRGLDIDDLAQPYESMGDVGRGIHDFRNNIVSLMSVEKKVLEVGCGCGKTAFEVSKVAESVLAIDIDNVAIDYALQTYHNENLEYSLLSFEKLDNGTFDVICSFEAGHQFSDYDRFLKRVHSLLNENGIMIVTMPNAKKKKFPFFIHDLSKDTLKGKLESLGFEIVMFWGYESKKTIRLWNYLEKRREFKTTCGDIIVSTEQPEKSPHFLVVCKKVE